MTNGQFIVTPGDPILITGSNGFIGVKVVETLLEYGFFNLRCFVRPSSKLEKLKKVLKDYPGARNVEIVSGDLLSRPDCRKAAQGVSVIIHLAAGFDKSFAGAFMNSGLTTRNLIEAFLEHGQPKRFVNISSFAVYSNLKMERGACLDENSPLEDASQERHDAYGFGKLKQEQIVCKYGRTSGLPYVIVRPGAVFGPGKPELSGRVGINTFGFFMHLGGSNVVDDEKMTSREFLAARKQAKNFFSVNVPYSLAYLGCRLWETYSRRSQGQLPPVFNCRRCSAEWKGNHFSNEKLHTRLGWKPRVKMADAMKLFLAQYQ
jgi:nucleoside-diphosphate-sugar epimerase